MKVEDALLGALAAYYVYDCPYAKVEESFNLQATHDLLIHGIWKVEDYDHIDFPGVVPRTFIGSILVAMLTSPMTVLVKVFGLDKFILQYAVRVVLAMGTTSALLFLKKSVHGRFGSDTGRHFILICACQFHLLFYAGRTLPNIYALIMVICAMAFWLQNRMRPAISLFTFTTIVFRGDTAVFFAPFLLSLILARPNLFLQIIWWGISATIVSLSLTIAIDSYFWRRWLWPEGEVLWYNTVDNKSSDWGTSPPLWYFYSALPRALLATACLLPFGLSPMLTSLVTARTWTQVKNIVSLGQVIDRQVWPLFWPTFLYLSLFSLLPHKELRFIFNAVPVLNVISAVGMSKLYRARSKAILPYILACSCLVATLLATRIFHLASQVNYPGGEAFRYLHQMENIHRQVPKSVYIDVPAAMTGVSRFGETFPMWSYSKEETLTPKDMCTFHYVITANPPSCMEETFQIMQTFRIFDGLEPSASIIRTKEAIYLYEQK